MCCLFGLMDPRHSLSGRQKARLLRSLSNLQPAHLLDPAYLHLEDSSAKGTD